MKKLRSLAICCIALSFLVSACSANKTNDKISIPLLLNKLVLIEPPG